MTIIVGYFYFYLQEAVFVDDPMVQLNVNPLNIPLVEAKENFKNDHLGVQEDCQQVLEPEM